MNSPLERRNPSLSWETKDVDGVRQLVFRLNFVLQGLCGTSAHVVLYFTYDDGKPLPSKDGLGGGKSGLCVMRELSPAKSAYTNYELQIPLSAVTLRETRPCVVHALALLWTTASPADGEYSAELARSERLVLTWN